MKFNPLAAFVLALALLGPAAGPAWSQSEPTLDQIYQAANSGQLGQADAMIDQVLRNHPNSAKAHYVKAELAARESNAAVAREELATAERLAPGLPFARPEAVQALRNEVNGTSRPATAARGDSRQVGAPAARAPQPASPARGFSWGLAALVAAIAFVVFLVLRRRAAARGGGAYGGGMPSAGMGPQPMGPMGSGPGAPGNYPPGAYPPGAYPPGAYPGGYGNAPGGMGSSLGRGLATGLAVGAGAVAAQEIGRRMFDHDSSPVTPSATPADVEPGLLDPSVNADMGGHDFGVQDTGSWDDAGGGDAGGGGSDWDT